MRLYWRIVGRIAGDAAIAFVARGGVTLAGGVLPRISISSTRPTFRAAFEDKAPVDALARAIPTRLVTQADSVLVGMAAIAAAPDATPSTTRAAPGLKGSAVNSPFSWCVPRRCEHAGGGARD